MTPDITLWKQYVDAVDKLNDEKWQEVKTFRAEIEKYRMVTDDYVSYPEWPESRLKTLEDFLTWQVNGMRFINSKENSMKKILQFQVVDVTPFWKRLFTSHLEVNIFGLSEDGQILLVQGGETKGTETKGTEFIPHSLNTIRY